ncbi:MAG: phosphoribosyltransferase family protein [Flavobacteriales bacterium]
MPAERTLLLDHERVQRKLRRIAIQLQEEHWNAGSLVLAGIAPRGTKLAQRLARMLAEGSQLQVDVMELTLDKDAPLARPPKSSLEPSALRGRTVVLVDDVLMSGRTLMHAAAYLVAQDPARLTTVVLVDRRHRTFPIRADIVGLTLSTTVQEHISVELGRRDAVYIA